MKAFTAAAILCITAMPAAAFDAAAFRPYLSKTCPAYDANLNIRLQGDLANPVMVVAFSRKSKFAGTAPVALKTKQASWGKAVCWEAKLRKTNKFYNGSTVSLCLNPNGNIWAGGRPSTQLRNIGWGKETYNDC